LDGLIRGALVDAVGDEGVDVAVVGKVLPPTA
jgi:hypothetical protein